MINAENYEFREGEYVWVTLPAQILKIKDEETFTIELHPELLKKDSRFYKKPYHVEMTIQPLEVKEQIEEHLNKNEEEQ